MFTQHRHVLGGATRRRFGRQLRKTLTRCDSHRRQCARTGCDCPPAQNANAVFYDLVPYFCALQRLRSSHGGQLCAALQRLAFVSIFLGR